MTRRQDLAPLSRQRRQRASMAIVLVGVAMALIAFVVGGAVGLLVLLAPR